MVLPVRSIALSTILSLSIASNVPHAFAAPPAAVLADRCAPPITIDTTFSNPQTFHSNLSGRLLVNTPFGSTVAQVMDLGPDLLLGTADDGPLRSLPYHPAIWWEVSPATDGRIIAYIFKKIRPDYSSVDIVQYYDTVNGIYGDGDAEDTVDVAPLPPLPMGLIPSFGISDDQLFWAVNTSQTHWCTISNGDCANGIIRTTPISGSWPQYMMGATLVSVDASGPRILFARYRFLSGPGTPLSSGVITSSPNGTEQPLLPTYAPGIISLPMDATSGLALMSTRSASGDSLRVGSFYGGATVPVVTAPPGESILAAHLGRRRTLSGDTFLGVSYASDIGNGEFLYRRELRAISDLSNPIPVSSFTTTDGSNEQVTVDGNNVLWVEGHTLKGTHCF